MTRKKEPFTIYVFHGKKRDTHFLIPGVKKEDVKIDTNNQLHSLKLKAGKYTKNAYFPGTEYPKNVKSEYKNGILTVTFSSEKKSRKIR